MSWCIDRAVILRRDAATRLGRAEALDYDPLPGLAFPNVPQPPLGVEMVNRRAFLYGSIAALTVPLAARAQQAGKVHRIGILQPGSNTPAINFTEALRQGLRDHGYVDGQNAVIEHRLSPMPKENLC
jgi:hypothetical protein